MKTWRSADAVPPFLTSGADGGESSVLCPGRFNSGRNLLEPIEYKTGWAAESVWTQWDVEKPLPNAGNRTPAVQTIAHRYII
jgi:hypothetical protein